MPADRSQVVEVQRLQETMARYDDPDDKLTIAVGNFNRLARQLEQVEAERGRIRSVLEMANNASERWGAERDRYREALDYVEEHADEWIAEKARAALHPKERDDG